MLAPVLKATQKALHPMQEFRSTFLKRKLRAFEPKVVFRTEYKDYEIKTAETFEELQSVLRLRYEVFVKEGLKKRKLSGVDFDRYDLMGDHVLIRRKDDKRALGTYRLLSSEFTDEFYSQSEFDMSDFINSPGNKLELGRACIHKDFRSGSAISIVWKGLGKYAQLTKADYFFGCSSVKTTDAKESMAIFQELKTEHFDGQFEVRPLPEFKFDSYPSFVEPEIQKIAVDKIPTLLKSYLKAGSKIAGLPAYDRDFQCIDFLTILNLSKVDPRYRERYFQHDDSI